MIKDATVLLQQQLKLLIDTKWQIESMNRNLNIKIPESYKVNQAFGFLHDALAHEIELLEDIINKMQEKK